MPTVTLLPDNRILDAAAGQTLHACLVAAGVLLDAPCGGRGHCGKCTVTLEGREVPACRTVVDRDMTVTLPPKAAAEGTMARGGCALAFDIGTTTVVAFLLDSRGRVIQSASVRNPQVGFGADVVSRIQAAQAGHRETMTGLIRRAMTELILQLCDDPRQIETVSVVGNPAMQQLFLGVSLENLARIPFDPVLCKPEVLDCGPYLPVCPKARLLTVPDISGFVGADTVAAVLSCGMQDGDALTLLVDIGTNGEMVLGNRRRMIACSTAAGPALEGANIQFGMRAEPGAIDRVWVELGALRCHTVGEGDAVGICGSGLLDAVAAAMDLGLVNRRGRLQNGDKIMLTEKVCLTQEDIRQVMAAKGAIRAGIDLMVRQLGLTHSDIDRVVLAGAFGSCLSPGSACRIGLLPPELLGRITAVGNAAGSGACMLAAAPDLLETAGAIARKAEYLNLASLPAFPRAFARAMELPENWVAGAKALGFDEACGFDPAILAAREDVRAMCAADKCHAYGKNWTCPPNCGTLEACQEKMGSYRRGILVQTVGKLQKTIDTKGYRAAEQRHLQNFGAFCDALRRQYPNALCLGTGGCRICKKCAWPEPCRFPEKACSSMEGYGLFVTQVCRDCGADYHHGEKTVTYTACILY